MQHNSGSIEEPFQPVKLTEKITIEMEEQFVLDNLRVTFPFPWI